MNSDKSGILILAGTGDAKNLVEYLFARFNFRDNPVTVSVVTENAAADYRKKQIPVRTGALNESQMASFINDENISVIIDATHPFALDASRNAISVANQTSAVYIRYERPDIDFTDESGQISNHLFVNNHEEAAALTVLLQKKLNQNMTVMLATGAKSLEVYAKAFQAISEIKIIARLLPTVENMELCIKQGIPQANIIGMQGPFSKELNRELFLKYGVNVLISKESGSAGSAEEKMLAARELGITTIIIDRPDIAYPNLCRNFAEVEEKLRETLNTK